MLRRPVMSKLLRRYGLLQGQLAGGHRRTVSLELTSSEKPPPALLLLHLYYPRNMSKENYGVKESSGADSL